jgi:hypothetical protein
MVSEDSAIVKARKHKKKNDYNMLGSKAGMHRSTLFLDSMKRGDVQLKA